MHRCQVCPNSGTAGWRREGWQRHVLAINLWTEDAATGIRLQRPSTHQEKSMNCIRPKANLLRLDGLWLQRAKSYLLSRSAPYKQLKALSHFVGNKGKGWKYPGKEKSGGFFCVCGQKGFYLWSMICDLFARNVGYWITEVFIKYTTNKIILERLKRIKKYSIAFPFIRNVQV